MITKFNVGGETTGALGSFLLEDANVARKKALRDDALAAARKAEQVVMVLGIRSGGYGLFGCQRKRRPGHEQPVCLACNCTDGAMAPFSDPEGPYGAVPKLNCNNGNCKGTNGTLVGGQYIEAETHDRTSIDLPLVQHELAKEIIALGTAPSIIERRPALFFLGRISPIFARLFAVFSRFSPS